MKRLIESDVCTIIAQFLVAITLVVCVAGIVSITLDGNKLAATNLERVIIERNDAMARAGMLEVEILGLKGRSKIRQTAMTTCIDDKYALKTFIIQQGKK